MARLLGSTISILFSLLLLALLPWTAISKPLWGPTGHALTATIAQKYLDTLSNRETKEFLPQSQGQMSAVASWADQIRDEPEWGWTAPLHYINTPDWACTYDPSSDCPGQQCVAGALLNYTQRLSDPSIDFDSQQNALKFVIHFVGDVHQPLHVSFGSDKGGNDINGQYFGSTFNLHQVWDTEILAGRIKYDFNNDQDQYLAYLLDQMAGPWKDQVSSWAACNGIPLTSTSSSSSNSSYPYFLYDNGFASCVDAWASDTAAIACQYAYTDQDGNHITNNFNLGQAYYDYVKGVVDMQLAKGGIRLATTLNALWQNS